MWGTKIRKHEQTKGALRVIEKSQIENKQKPK